MDFTQQSKRIAVVIVAGGTGTRFGSQVPKQYLPLASKPLIRRSIETFLTVDIKTVLTVIHPNHAELYQTAIAGLTLPPPVFGGATRAASTLAGLNALQIYSPDYVLIHDAARPFVDKALIQRVIDGLELAPGCIPAVQVIDTIKQVSNQVIQQTLPRHELWRAQTPQGFHYAKIVECFAKTTDFSFTDEAALLESFKLPVRIVEGSEDNIKITFQGDLRGN
nr:2-C-methyl-D-erythritol 4-phosphate cytidylyltransferase [Candidatus Odyssella thessalonicensis]